MTSKTGIGLASAILLILSQAVAAAGLQGHIVDNNGHAVAGAMITVSAPVPGPTALTVFSDGKGQFKFPADDNYGDGSKLAVSIRALGYELDTAHINAADKQALKLTVIARATVNQVASAPASAWLGRAADHEAVSSFVMDCVGCHQVPAPQFRAYADAIADIQGSDRHDISHQGWHALVQYMSLISSEEFARGAEAKSVDVQNVYSVKDAPSVTNFLADHFPGRMDEIHGFNWGAPLAVTSDTVIREYEIPQPNAVREALLLGKPKQLYVADVASNRIFKVDPASGYTSVITIPAETDVGPHSLHRGADGSLWMAPFVSSVVGHYDIASGQWKTWPMKDITGKSTGVHDLSFGAEHTLLTDKDGYIWFSDVTNNAIGYLDPATGKSEIYRAPEPPGRPGNGSMYGLVMTADREHLWFSQLRIGNVGSFNIKTRKFEQSFMLPTNAGPRRLGISADGILYVPLYGRGQLVEYDTKAYKLIGQYDLPDTASAPYATVWDPLRKVVWVTTTNADVLYRFDPRDKSIAALPLPRMGALIRTLDVDPDTGVLVTSYGNIVQQVHGPRMALMIDPGDHVIGQGKGK
ncbi:MAG TPA: hypothetical protein VMH83_01625 [Candidatus Acidoferrum sp.]|nr:hypothetical protein [Candidatus Acidoferrum sp.]